MQVLREEEYRAMPWKNGLGVTREIAVHPDGASLDEFGWRISMAQVNGPGPFSLFHGCDRILCVVRGGPLSLSVGSAEPVHLGIDAPPFHFAADMRAEVTAFDGCVLDFNVMVRRDHYSAEVDCCRGTVRLPASDHARAVFVKEGAARTQDGTMLRCGDTVLVDREGTVVAAGDDASFFIVTIVSKASVKSR